MNESSTSSTDVTRVRREPPPLQLVKVTARQELSPRMLRFRFEGSGLRDLAEADPAASVRLVVPSSGEVELVIPTWNGNEFLLPDGSRPSLRTFTPLRIDRTEGALDVWIVRHPGGAVSTWAETAVVGAKAAISGPGKGYPIDPTVPRFVLLGDETAIPAITDLLGTLPSAAHIEVHVEAATKGAEIPLPDHPRRSVVWHVREEGAPGASLARAIQSVDELDEYSRVWAAGEAASMQAIRKHLFDVLGVPRSHTSIRGYWKPPR